jgi:hypothetical protein
MAQADGLRPFDFIRNTKAFISPLVLVTITVVETILCPTAPK